MCKCTRWAPPESSDYINITVYSSRVAKRETTQHIVGILCGDIAWICNDCIIIESPSASLRHSVDNFGLTRHNSLTRPRERLESRETKVYWRLSSRETKVYSNFSKCYSYHSTSSDSGPQRNCIKSASARHFPSHKQQDVFMMIRMTGGALIKMDAQCIRVNRQQKMVKCKF